MDYKDNTNVAFYRKCATKWMITRMIRTIKMIYIYGLYLIRRNGILSRIGSIFLFTLSITEGALFSISWFMKVLLFTWFIKVSTCWSINRLFFIWLIHNLSHVLLTYWLFLLFLFLSIFWYVNDTDYHFLLTVV